MKSPVPRRHRAAIVLVVALLSLAFALEGSQPVHSHENGRLGIYNAECPLAELAAVHAEGWTPTPVTSEAPASIVLGVAVMSSGWVPRPFASLTASRAPPLV